MNMARGPRYEAIGVSSQYQSLDSGLSPVPSEFESVVLLSTGLPPEVSELIGVLLTSAGLMNDNGCEVLRPLWAEERMHRIHGFMRLIGAQIRRESITNQIIIASEVADFAARDLASRLRALEAAAERAILPCSTLMPDVVSDLETLFGRPANVTFATTIESMWLPGYQRRALVLAACELICNALLHAFPGREAGLIEVGLTLRGRRSACLRVADNGVGFADTPPNLTCGVAAGLADLLEADLTYTRSAGWTIAEIVFPVRAEQARV